MKHILYTIAFLCISNMANSQQAIKPLITKHTATWCPSCGTWGWNAMKQLVTDLHGSDATVMALHFSGNLENDLNKTLASNFPSVGQPVFMADGVDLDFTSSSWEAKLEDLKTQIATNTASINKFEINSAEYAVDADTGDEIQVTIDYDINNLPVGEYSIGIYLVRDNIISSQSGQSGDVAHLKILDVALTEEPFGTAISNLQGEISITYDVLSDEGLTEYLGQEVVTILWDKVGESYTSITTNSSLIEEKTLSSLSESLKDANLYKVYQNRSGDIQFEAISNTQMNGELVSIYSVTGRKLDSQSIVNGKAIFHQGLLNGKGLYLVRVESNSHAKTLKVLVK